MSKDFKIQMILADAKVELIISWSLQNNDRI